MNENTIVDYSKPLEFVCKWDNSVFPAEYMALHHTGKCIVVIDFREGEYFADLADEHGVTENCHGYLRNVATKHTWWVNVYDCGPDAEPDFDAYTSEEAAKRHGPNAVTRVKVEYFV